MKGKHMKFMIYRDVKGAYRWRLYITIDGPAIAEGTAAYPTKTECLAVIEAVKGSAAADVEDLSSGPPASSASSAASAKSSSKSKP